MVANIVYKLSCFANYSMLSYNKDDVISILKLFEDPTLAPATVKEIRVDGTMTQRMHFIAQNGLFTMQVNSDRIDITITAENKEGFLEDSLPSVKEKLISSMQKLISVFGDRAPNANRLAWNTSYVYFEITDEEKKLYRGKFQKELDYFKDNSIDDTVIRYAGRRIKTINGNDEWINILATINSYLVDPGSEMEVDGFRIDYDINTWQGSRANRFDGSAVNEFVSIALSIQEELNKEILP